MKRRHFIVFLCLLVGCLSSATPAQDIPDQVPAANRAAYDEAMRWLDEMIEQWRPEKPRKVVFSGQCLAVEACPHHPEADALYVDMLCEAGVNAIDVYPWPALWKRDPQRYDRLVEHIRRRGKKLILGYQVLPRRYRAGSVEFRFEPYFRRPPSFEEFLALQRELTEIYIKRYRPELYWVVVEPATNEGRLDVRYSRCQWRRLVQEMCRLAKRLRPQTETGATAVHVKQLEPLADVPELDVLGCDLYARRDLDEVDKLVALAKRHGKKAWLAETWLGHARMAGFDQPWRAPLDAKWIQAARLLAQSRGLEGVNIWFTTHFAAYITATDQADYERRFLKALQQQERTPVFRAVRNLHGRAR